MVNLLSYKTLLTLSAAIPNGSGRAVNFCTFWSDEGLEYMFEPVGPDSEGKFSSSVIPSSAGDEAMREALDALVYDFIGALIWVHRPVFSWDDCYDFAVDLSGMPTEEALHEWRAPISLEMVCDLTVQAVHLLEAVAELLKPIDPDPAPLDGETAVMIVANDPAGFFDAELDEIFWQYDLDKEFGEDDENWLYSVKPEDLWIALDELSDDE